MSGRGANSQPATAAPTAARTAPASCDSALGTPHARLLHLIAAQRGAQHPTGKHRGDINDGASSGKLPASLSRLVALATLTGLIASATGCQTQPPIPDRSYLALRNSVDPAKPCRMVKFTQVPIRTLGKVAIVPFAINDVQTIAVLDTGADITAITHALANQAGLRTNPQLRPMRMSGMSGGFDVQLAFAHTIQYGGFKTTLPPAVAVLDFVRSSTAIGANLGLDLLDGFDWDLDFPHDKMTAFQTQNCTDVDPAWTTKSTGLAITRGLPDLMGDGKPKGDLQLTIPVQFDGGTLVALLDTGASHSYLTRAGAHKAGITNAELDRDPFGPMKSIDGRTRKVRRHNVAELVVGEDIERNFPVDVAEYFNRDEEFDMILGMDWIAKHHLWLSLTTDSLYINSGEPKPASWKPTPTFDK